MLYNRDLEKAHEIATEVARCGGRAYFVGGYVRDKILGIENSDIDIEVHGISVKQLELILDSLGSRTEQGASFGIYKLNGYDVDIAMPRTEEKIGTKHTDFKTLIDPFIGVEKASRRRDFTINSIMMDCLTGDIIDPNNGVSDLKHGIIRHVDSKSFIEDPLRVLRAARFSARFNFRISDSTIELCKTMDLKDLSSERIYWELIKLFESTGKPSIFFESLREMNQLGYWFMEIQNLIGVEQNPIYHREGDVWTHTMMVLDYAHTITEQDYAGYMIEPINKNYFMLACLCHDLGKPEAYNDDCGRVTSINHEKIGLKPAEQFILRITQDRKIMKYVLNMVEMHMKPNMCANSHSHKKATNRMFNKSIDTRGLLLLAKSDYLGRIHGDPDYKNIETWLMDRLEHYTITMSKPFVQGRDLVAAGIKPGEYFSELLEYSHKLRLADVCKEKALKQTIAYYNKIVSKATKN